MNEDKKKLLIVDDEQGMANLLKRRLEANGYKVVTACDGEAGLEKARSEKPDLIILDLMLPKMDGYKVCILLKKDTEYRKIPIILFSARAQQSDEKLGLECGANAYITKPFNPQKLLDKIKELLEAAVPSNVR